jgi:tRNA (Thr-GGU) A37 N-methylase
MMRDMAARAARRHRMSKIEIAPIGRVSVDESKGSYALVVDAAYRKGLESLGEFGRIQALWWAHGVDDATMRSTLSCELPYAPGVRAGVFACRSEYRPNPIALTSCGVLAVDQRKGLVTLDYIDAADGTPLLDIKPYIPVCDRAKDFKVPAWFRSWPEWIEGAGEFFSGPDAPNTGAPVSGAPVSGAPETK